MTAIHCRSGPASVTRSTNSGWVMAATHWAFSTKYAISAATDLVLVVTPTAPTVAQASQARTISGQFSEWIRTLSSRPMPRAARPAARRRVSAHSSA